MTRSKLSDFEKQEITQLFCESVESISSLANRFNVSSSTVRRILKANLAADQYEQLNHAKPVERRSAVGPEAMQVPPTDESEISEPVAEAETQEFLAPEPPASVSEPDIEPVEELSQRRSRRRSSAPTKSSEKEVVHKVELQEDKPDLDSGAVNVADTAKLVNAEDLDAVNVADAARLVNAEDLDDDLAVENDLDDMSQDDDDDLEDDIDDDLDDDDLEDEEESDFSNGSGSSQPYAPHIQPDALVHILPLSEALIPRTCYLVVDRSAELITRPLKEFADLGEIPSEEIQNKTLPVFDNHRMARRFSNRIQRVIKVPDGTMLKKACSQLSAKGISRMLINGQVYSL